MHRCVRCLSNEQNSPNHWAKDSEKKNANTCWKKIRRSVAARTSGWHSFITLACSRTSKFRCIWVRLNFEFIHPKCTPKCGITFSLNVYCDTRQLCSSSDENIMGKWGASYGSVCISSTRYAQVHKFLSDVYLTRRTSQNSWKRLRHRWSYARISGMTPIIIAETVALNEQQISTYGTPYGNCSWKYGCSE